MTPSIRTFLLINLLLSVTLITSLAIIGNLFLAHKDIQTQLDLQLMRTATRIEAFFSDERRLTKAGLARIQQNLNTKMNPNTALKKYTPKQNSGLAKSEIHESMVFQIWNKDKELILHSPNSPKQAFTKHFKPGFSNLWLNGQEWRINTVYNKNSQLTIMVAERDNYRQALEDQLTQDSIFIMLITYPFLGFLIWVIVGRGLGTLKEVAEEVKHRAPTFLKPVDLESVPAEVEPLVSELNSLFARLQDAFMRNKRFTADAAHELKTPLAALSTQVQVALRANNDEARNQAMLKVLAGVNRSTHVVQQLLTLSRMDPQDHIKDPAPVVLAKQAMEVAALLAPEAIAKNIELELLTPDCKATLNSNPTFIAILIRNLVDNAIRYSYEGGYVRINIEEDNKHIYLSVTDNGPGIPEELRERVFERFFRVIGNKTTGSGLGLGIVSQIVKLHDADIALETPENGKGLRVKITFPKS